MNKTKLPTLVEFFNLRKKPIIKESGGMSHDEAMEATVTKSQAQAEIKRHQGDWNDFVKEVGDKPNYKGSEVLEWLGY